MCGETKASAFGPIAFKAVRLKLIESGMAITTIRERMGIIRRMVACDPSDNAGSHLTTTFPAWAWACMAARVAAITSL